MRQESERKGVIGRRRESHVIIAAVFNLGIMALLLGISPRGACAEGDSNPDILTHGRLEMFVDDLPTLPRVLGYGLNDEGKFVSKSLDIGMFCKRWKFHRDLPPTPVFAYGTSHRTATVPGPEIHVKHGVSTYITWQNYLPSQHILPWDPTIPVAMPASKTGVPTVPHLHGGIHAPGSDGHSSAWFTSGFRDTGPTWQNRTYHYPNKQTGGTLWYHDHAMGLTRVNLLAGLVGPYIIHQARERRLKLPCRAEFDRTLIIFDRSFLKNGSIYMDPKGNNPTIHPVWQPEYFGDMIVVNGKVWPKLKVRRRLYRFRIINTSNARFLRLKLSNGLPFFHIGSDSVYLHRPVINRQFLLAPSEIADVVIDFSKSHSHHAILLNNAPYPYPGGDAVNDANSKVMKFEIMNDREHEPFHVPTHLIQYRIPNPLHVVKIRYITMYEYASATDEPMHLYINGLPYSAPVTETPKVGTNEVWYVINLTEDNHPLHIHLGLFTLLDQVQILHLDKFKDCMTRHNDAEACGVLKQCGKHVIAPEYERGWKNVFKLMPGYLTKLYVTFSYIHNKEPYGFDATAEPGYAYHCHILDHEDNQMMRPLKLTN